MVKRLNFRFYPSPKQEELLAKTFGCCRFVYNSALKSRIDAYEKGEKPNYSSSSKNLTMQKREPTLHWLKEVSSVALQQSLRHLDVAYKNFFQKRSKFPKFKSRRNEQKFSLAKTGFQWRPESQSLILAKIGRLRVKWSRLPQSEPSSLTITKSASGKYFVSMVVDEASEPLPKTGSHVGVDLGLHHIATLSNGEKIPNPRIFWKWEKRLAREQRILSRRKKGSGRRERQRIRVARVYEKIRNIRKDFLDKLTTSLVAQFDSIAIEDLDVKGMSQNRCLSKSLGDASFGMIRSMLEYKCNWSGRELKLLDRFFPSSKTCHSCSHKVDSLPLSIRQWECASCKKTLDRDVNAAKNILKHAVGQTVKVRGEIVRRKPSGERKSRGNVNHLNELALAS